MNIVGSGRPINTYPFYYQMDNFREFSKIIRRDAFTLALWASENWISKYHLYIYIHVQEDMDEDNCWEWDFAIKCENIREYKPYLNLQQEEMERLKVERDRNAKINDILNFPEIQS